MATGKKGISNARPKAKNDKKEGKDEKAVSCPSSFGSHNSMANSELSEKIPSSRQNESNPWIILTDERGSYATQKLRLDTGLADPNRFADTGARETLLSEVTAV